MQDFPGERRDGGQGGPDDAERFRPFTDLEFKILGQVEQFTDIG
jgi:hypothetical protein